MDAHFVRLEQTNIVVLTMNGLVYWVAVTNFSDADRAYVNRVKDRPVDEEMLIQADRANRRPRTLREAQARIIKAQEDSRKEAEWKRQLLINKATEIREAKLKIVELEQTIADGESQPTLAERKARQIQVDIARRMVIDWRRKLTELYLDYAKMATSVPADVKAEADRLIGG